MYIVTHPGKSHADDRMAVSLILSRFGDMPVFRREPNQAELDDANVFVVDIGMQYDPVLRNFDHHQLHPNAVAECAMSMLIDSGVLGPEITAALQDQPWVRAIAMIDAKGPDHYCKFNGKGVLPHFPFDLESPAELGLQWMFERGTGHDKKAEVTPATRMILQSIGDNVIARAIHEKYHLDLLLDRAQLVEADYLKGFVAQTDDRRINERYALELSEPPLDFAIYPSIRGAGWRITRMTDKVPLNFYKVVDDPRVEFAHKSGFTLATKDKISMEECVDLVKKSLIESEE